ncbi:MAG: hypothetical protein JWQ90_2336 [Hydrocarboniphaga sp.]|uniref:SDR family NAD(P)-dependent oxidoreductase n=1 Tax=Hydrocarboniphaga sp. TaxID=2033016 RepID=UPI00262702E3|nr:SDR family oxidoreductase [Hydrocarboniphaga sp.]MDB5969886.1 hypothetical protein [Hydrocarboniphaga sp.]
MAFHGKVALVTGGGSGMGRAMALRHAQQGAKVAILDLNETALADTAALSPKLKAYRCDVTDEEQVIDTVARIEAELGPIDRGVHAAGIMPGDTILNMSSQKITQVMKVNYFGTVHVTKALLPRLLERKHGDLICFGSITGYAFSTSFSAYCASKAAVNAYMEILIHEHQKSGLRILLVAPPAVDTPLINQALETGPAAIRMVKEKKRMASVDSILDAIETAIEKGQTIVLPGEAKPTYLLRRLSPKLLWKISDKVNKVS